jgi:hypothetical protein
MQDHWHRDSRSKAVPSSMMATSTGMDISASAVGNVPTTKANAVDKKPTAAGSVRRVMAVLMPSCALILWLKR